MFGYKIAQVLYQSAPSLSVFYGLGRIARQGICLLYCATAQTENLCINLCF